MTTEDRLAAIAARVTAASPAESWQVDEDGQVMLGDNHLQGCGCCSLSLSEGDTQLIVTAPTDLAYLLTLVQRQRAVVEAAQQTIAARKRGQMKLDALEDAVQTYQAALTEGEAGP